MRRCSLALLWMVAGSGCPVDDPVCEGPVTVTAISYNVANQTGPNGDNIAAQIAQVAPDFVAAQECDSCDYLIDRLPAHYQLTAAPRAGVAILYDSAAWEVADQGVVSLGEDDDGWGERVARWARFSDRATGRCLYFFSTHWCVTVRNPDDGCDVDRQLDYAALVVETIEARSGGEAPVVLAGDLNVFDGFEDGPVVAYLFDSGLVDLFRVADPEGDGTTFQGNDWAPPGRIDYLLATPPVAVDTAFIDRETIPAGEGSDHYPVVATVELGLE